MASVSTPAPERRFSPIFSIFTLCVVVAILFVLQLRHFSPFMTDDAYISLRYSQRLIEGHGLTWNDGIPVEGYTNLLWVLICAAMGSLHIPLPLAAHILGITTTVLMLVAAVAYIYRFFPVQVRFFSALLTCAALVLSSPFAMWSLGGLEQPLLACMLVWAAFLMLPWLQEERPRTSTALAIGLLLGLAVVSRADGALFTASFFGAAVICDGIGRKSILSRARILPLPILFFLGQLAFRRAYYHDWLPNTAYVKVAFTAHRLWTGLRYLYLALKVDGVLMILVVLASLALWRSGRSLYRKSVLFLWIVAVVWTAYLVLIGGDIFPAVRHFEPLVALFGFLLPGLGLLAVDQHGSIKTGVAAALIGAAALVATSDLMVFQEHWERQGESLGIFLHRAFGSEQPLLSSDAAGVVPFFAHVPVLDPLGLNDYHIAHEASRVRGYGWVGHELGDGPYILDQKPDLLLFSSFDGESGLFLADQEIVDDPRFKEFYQPFLADTPEPNSIRALLYLRRRDGRIGMHSTPKGLVVPGYLADVDRLNSVHLMGDKAMLVVPAHGSATFERLPLDAGEWTIEFTPDSAFTLGALKGAERGSGCAACFRVPASSQAVSVTINNPTSAPLNLESMMMQPRQRGAERAAGQ